MGEKDYFISLYADSAVRLSEPLQVQLGDCDIEISETQSSPLKDFFPDLKWAYTVRTSAIGPISAIWKAERFVSFLNDIITINETAAIDDPTPFISYDTDKSEADREFAQPLYMQTDSLRTFRPFSSGKLRKFLESYSGFGDVKDRRRIDRALRFYGRAHLEADPIDKYEDLWTALEALNPLIRDKFQTHRHYQITCKHCSDPVFCRNCDGAIEEVDSSSGIKYLIEEILGEKEIWSALRRTRIEIVHSTEDPFEVTREIAPKTQMLRKAVIAGVNNLLDNDESDWEGIAEYPLPLSASPRFMLKGKILATPPGNILADVENLPSFRFSDDIATNDQATEMEDGIRVEHLKIVPQGFPDGAQFTYQVRVEIKKGPSDLGVTDFGVSTVEREA